MSDIALKECSGKGNECFVPGRTALKGECLSGADHDVRAQNPERVHLIVHSSGCVLVVDAEEISEVDGKSAP